MNYDKENKFGQLNANCDYIIKCCKYLKFDSYNEIIVKCNKLVKISEFINGIAHQYTFLNLPYNGFKLFINIATAFSDKLITRLKNENKIDSDLNRLFDLIFAYYDLIIHNFDLLDNNEINKNNKSLLVYKSNLSSKIFYKSIHLDRKSLSLVFSSYTAFWLPNQLKIPLNLYCKTLSVLQNLPYSLTSLWNSESAGDYCVEAFKSCNLNYPFNLWQLSESWIFSKLFINLLHINTPVQSITLNIPKQTRFRITYKGKILDFDKLTKDEKDDYFNDKEEQERQNSPGLRHRNKETIRCRYSFINSNTKIKESLDRIKNKKFNDEIDTLKYYSASKTINDNYLSELDRLNNNSILTDENTFKSNELPKTLLTNQTENLACSKILLLWIHGGGFISLGATSSEIFLKQIVNELNGIPTLSIDYSLTVPFPIANQEILDVYLWLFSGKQDVEDKIGFHPKKIVLAGDSAGGLLALQQTITINELNKLSDHKIPLPISIVTVYAAFTMNFNSISKSFFMLEPLINCHIFLIMLSMYGANVSKISDFKKIEKTELFQQIALKNKKLFEENIIDDDFDFDSPKKSNDNSPWFSVDYKTYKNYADYITSFYSNPIIAPALYDKFDELKNVKLFALCGKNDFLVDDSIELANKWKGSVIIDLIENVVHGFLYMQLFSKDNSQSLKLVIHRIQQACGLI